MAAMALKTVPDGRRRIVLASDGQFNVRPRNLSQAASGCFFCDVRPVAFLADMGENDVLSAGIDDPLQELHAGDITQVAMSSHNALLQGPGALGGGQQVKVVVAFQDYRVALAQLVFNRASSMAEVGGNADFVVTPPDHESDWVVGVVRNGERLNIEGTD